MSRKLTTLEIRNAKSAGGPPLVAVTAYDYSLARLVDELVEIVLVGDSLGMVVQGHANTLSVTMDEIVYHTRAVARALRHAHLVADMPFLSYQACAEDALRNAGRLLAEGGAEAVKIEGGSHLAPTIERLCTAGIPVMGHLGLTPQSVHAMGGFRIQGRSEAAQEKLLEDALALERAGAYAIVLEGIPAEAARRISGRIGIPTIGIGAGAGCDGQILVMHDLLGLNPDFRPKFARAYADLAGTVREAVGRYAADVRARNFPALEHSFSGVATPEAGASKDPRE